MKKEKMNGLVGAKNSGGEGQPKEKQKMNVLVGAKTGGGAGRANLRKKRKEMDK